MLLTSKVTNDSIDTTNVSTKETQHIVVCKKGGNKMYSVIVAENEVDLSGDINIMFEFTAINEAISFAEQMIKQGKAVEVFRE